jgi:enoyl-CoA hydratase
VSAGDDSGSEPHVLIDEPADKIRRFTLNRPDKRNALGNQLREELFDGLRAGDRDRSISVMIIRGSGPAFSSGYDLAHPNRSVERSIAKQDGWWSRHVVNNWFEMWDMATPIVAQVHGWCLAGGTELANACDLIYVAEDAKIGYPPVRLMSPPDMQWQTWTMGLRRGMEALLTGDHMSGLEAVQAGAANRAFPEEDLDVEVLAIAQRIAKIPADLLALNKRAAHRAMDAMGIRNGIRSTADIQALGFHQESSIEYMSQLGQRDLKESLSARDAQFGDYREREGDN